MAAGISIINFLSWSISSLQPLQLLPLQLLLLLLLLLLNLMRMTVGRRAPATRA